MEGVDAHRAKRLGGGWAFEVKLERESGAVKWSRSIAFSRWSDARQAAASEPRLRGQLVRIVHLASGESSQPWIVGSGGM